MNPPSALRPEPSAAPPEQREVRSEGGPFSNFAFRIPKFPLTPSPLNPLTPRRPRAAFTLIELMVAAGITTLLLLGMTGIFDQSMKAWRLSSRRADAEREVRGALAQIKRDLSCMIVNSNLPIAINQSRISGQFINVASSGFQLLLANHALKTGNPGVDWSNASSVLFFATTGGSGQGNSGDVSGVGYFVTYDTNSNQGRGAWNLYRRYQRPVDLLAGLQARIASPLVGPYHINTLSEPELIGANVFNFFAQPVNILTNAGGTNTNMVSKIEDLQTGINLTIRPKYVQLELTAYGSEQVRGFQRADWFNTNNITKFGRSFIWRVDL